MYLVINSSQNASYSCGLGYISSFLKEGGHNVDYFALKGKKDAIELYKKIKEKRPKIIGFSVTTSQFVYLDDITREIRDISDVFIVCGGIHPTLKPDCIFENHELNAIVRGEGESPMLDLANTLGENTCLNIQNFWFKEEKGIVRNALRPLIKNLDSLPFPDKSLLDYQALIDGAGGSARFIFSRGCVFECAYCSNKALSSLYKEIYFRLRSPQKAIEEIELDASKYNFNHIVFDDDTITLDKKWFYEFFSLYKRKFKYSFTCNVRVDTINEDMVRLLKEAGARCIICGMEHGNEEFRKIVLKKNITNRQIIDCFNLFDKYGIENKSAQVMTGLPFENKKLFIDTVKLCRRLKLAPFKNISIFYPYPGTELGEICRENGWLPAERFCREREEATIDYPGFNRREIQLCYDIFPFLLRFRFFPVSLPFGCNLLLLKFYRLIIILQNKITLPNQLRFFVILWHKVLYKNYSQERKL